MKLVELKEEYQNILEAIESTCDDGGMVDPELAKVLHEMQGKIEEKLGAYAGIIVTLAAQQKIVDAEAERLKRQSKALADHIAFMKEAAKQAMKLSGIEKLEVGVRKLRIQKNSQPALTIAEPDKLPAEFWVQPPKEISNEYVREALKSGRVIEGCTLTYGDHVRVS